MMNILVTGGAGYIGSHTAKLLASLGHNPVVYDNLDRGHDWAVKWGAFVEADLENKDAIKKAIEEHQIEAVIHFAAHSQVGESMEKPEIYFRNNVMCTLTLLEAMHETGVKKIVVSSTAATYGDPEMDSMTEDHPQRPVNPYGESKLIMEKALKWYGLCHGLQWTALRYFNAAGADPDGEIGEDHEVESHLIPLVLFTLLGRREDIKVFGNDYDTPDGTAIRDYIHVTDLADAHIKALEYLSAGGESGAFNLGTGTGQSVRDVIKVAESVTGQSIPAVDAPRRAGDPPVLVASSEKAQKILSWTPQYSSLETIVRTAWEWHQKHHK